MLQRERFGRVPGSVKKSYWARISFYLLTDVWRGWRFRLGRHDTGSGTRHASFDVEASLDYITTVFADYKSYGRVDRFSGAAAEVGAGDSSGVAMLLRRDGCETVDLPDRFAPHRDAEHQARIYVALWQRYPDLPAVLGNPDPLDDRTFSGIQRIEGPDGACEEFFQLHQQYDYILSRAVLEHLRDPIGALVSMASALSAGGSMLHKVDLRDHGMHSRFDHELRWLETHERLHRRMTRASGRPNRILLNNYRDAMDATGMSYEFLVTHLAGVGEINPHVRFQEIPVEARDTACGYVERIRSKLAAPMREVATEDLAVAGFFLIARR